MEAISDPAVKCRRGFGGLEHLRQLGADILLSSALDVSPSGKWQSVFGEKSVIDAAIEGSWGLAGKLVTGGTNVGGKTEQRILNTTTGVAEKMGSDLVKGAQSQ